MTLAVTPHACDTIMGNPKMTTNDMTGSPDAEESLTADLAQLGLTAYPEQLAVARALQDAYDAGKGTVGFVEAPTASGKTLAMTQNALRNAATRRETVVIATPTVEICHQTMTALVRLQSSCAPYRGLVVRLVLGQQEFVSAEGASALADALDLEGRAVAAAIVRQWHADGGPGPTTSHPRYMRKGLELRLSAARHDVEVPDWADLTHAEEGDPAAAEHAAQFLPADVMVVTHAMLSRDLIKRYVGASRLRKATGVRSRGSTKEWWREAAEQRLEFEAEVEGRLPDYRRLIVDEAHLLRSNMEAALTSTVSVRQIVANVEKAARETGVRVPASTMPRLIAVQEAMSAHELMSRGGRVTVNWLADGGFGSLMEEAKETLDAIRLPKVPKSQAQREIARARYALKESLGARNAVRTTISWSPSRSYPSIAVGPRGLGAEFGFLWGRLESACAVSATLYTENKAGSAITYTAERLGVGPDARLVFAPVRASWIADAVTMYVPGADRSGLIPSEDPELRAAWIDEVAAQIARIQADETKGTLVLSTSRATTSDLHAALALRDDVDASRLIDGTIGRMGANRTIFEMMSRSGRRPIWIGQGPAWTGLDLDDRTIGTLVVPKLPFPPPRPGDTKGSQPTYDGEQVAHMMITLKQGLGRLVRSRHPSAKRAFVLDARIEGAGPARAAKGLLDGYRKYTLK